MVESKPWTYEVSVNEPYPSRQATVPFWWPRWVLDLTPTPLGLQTVSCQLFQLLHYLLVSLNLAFALYVVPSLNSPHYHLVFYCVFCLLLESSYTRKLNK